LNYGQTYKHANKEERFMKVDREIKQEASIAVSARVSMIDLANVVRFYESEGYRVKSMSQLIGWSVELLADILKANGKLSELVETVTEANRVLESRELYQSSLRRRSAMKIGTAIKFENMREEGILNVDERGAIRSSYNILHNKRSVEPLMPQVSNRDADWEKMKAMKQMEEHEKYVKMKEEGLKTLKDSGVKVISNEEAEIMLGRASRTVWDRERKEQEQLKELNKPIDIEELKRLGVVVPNDVVEKK
jgi:hypothetical protein